MPDFASPSERVVWTALQEGLPAGAVVLPNQRVTERSKDHEADFVVLLPDQGVVVVEVKGGGITHDGQRWMLQRNGRWITVDPVAQARGARYALRTFVEGDPRWVGRPRLVWSHAVVLPFASIPADFALADCPRWMVVDRDDMPAIVARLGDVPLQQVTTSRRPDLDDIALIEQILAGRPLPMRDQLASAAEHDERVERLTQDQAVILGAISQLNRVEIRGGAGSGKTWLAVEQARRLTVAGARVALMCYSRGLSEFLLRRTASLGHRERPAYVGTFHHLGEAWGAAPGDENDVDYWEHRLPAQMAALAQALAPGRRFDAIVIDESQDFADAWWPVALAALRDEETGGIFVFSDEGQQVFARYARPPVPLVPIVLDRNLRNTKPIAASFRSLVPMRMRVGSLDGPPVRFVPVATVDVVATADDEVDALLDDWRPADVALITTGSRHPEQVTRQGRGWQEYWASFWDDEQVFYGHVLGFKGLERRVVVLALNQDPGAASAGWDRARERLYVGLSRARDLLVVVGDPEVVVAIGGPDVARHLGIAVDPGASHRV